MTKRRSIDYIRLDDLVPATRNPKMHDEPAIGRSVGRFGYTEPLLVDDRTGRLVAGHGRVAVLQAMRDRGEDPPDGVVVTGAAWTVPVVRGWASRSDAEADAYLMASNRLSELGGWNEPLKDELLRELAIVDAELFLTAGFDESELHRLLAESQGHSDSALPPEEFPSYDESIPTQYTCPMCAYSWSGKPAGDPQPVESAS